MLEKRAFFADFFVEGIKEGFGSLPRLAVSDCTAVHFDYWDDLCGRAGEETFVRTPEVIAGEVLGFKGQAKFIGDGDGSVPGNSAQRAGTGGGGDDTPLVDYENVVSRTLRDITLVIEHDGFEVTRLLGFHLGHDVVQVVEGLDHRGQGGGVDPAGGDSDDLEAVFVVLGWIELDIRCNDDDGRGFAAFGGEAEVPGATGNQEPDIAIGKVV